MMSRAPRAAKRPFVEHRMTARADVPEATSGSGRLNRKSVNVPAEAGLVLVPAAAVADGNRSPIPAIRPDEFLRIEPPVSRSAARQQGVAEVFVLLPIPFGGELDEALEAPLQLAQLRLDVRRLFRCSLSLRAQGRSGPPELAGRFCAADWSPAQILLGYPRCGAEVEGGVPCPAGIPEEAAR